MTECSLDAAFFASLEELRCRADQAVEEAFGLRKANREMLQSRMSRGGETSYRIGPLPRLRIALSCHAVA